MAASLAAFDAAETPICRGSLPFLSQSSERNVLPAESILSRNDNHAIHHIW